MLPILTSVGHTGHSADVKMQMHLEGQTLSVGQLGPDLLILDTTIDHPPAEATIVLCVDGNERRWNGHLPEGISAGSGWVVIAAKR